MITVTILLALLVLLPSLDSAADEDNRQSIPVESDDNDTLSR